MTREEPVSITGFRSIHGRRRAAKFVEERSVVIFVFDLVSLENITTLVLLPGISVLKFGALFYTNTENTAHMGLDLISLGLSLDAAPGANAFLILEPASFLSETVILGLHGESGGSVVEQFPAINRARNSRIKERPLARPRTVGLSVRSQTH